MKVLNFNNSFVIRGLSSETKPAVGTKLKFYDSINNGVYEKPIETGDIYFEIDTGKSFMYGDDGWLEYSSGGGAGRLTQILDGSKIEPKNLTTYVGENISNFLVNSWPELPFELDFRFTTAASGDININFPPSLTIDGDFPIFSNGENWYVSVRNEVLTASKLELAVPDLDSCSWDDISRISQAGLASQYFSVGDRKAVHVQGTVGTLEVDETYYVYILGFDHNSEVEGTGITFGCFKDANGLDIALIDSNYGNNSDDGTKYFSINHSGYSSAGGWLQTNLRYDILGSVHAKNATNAAETTTTNPVANTLMAALPEDLRAVMRPIVKYSDNWGRLNVDPERMTATIEYLPLLSEFEIAGSTVYAHPYEPDHQVQYQYFLAGNAKEKYRPNGSSKVNYWLRSVDTNSTSRFCTITTAGNPSNAYSYNSSGLSPIFLV